MRLWLGHAGHAVLAVGDFFMVPIAPCIKGEWVAYPLPLQQWHSDLLCETVLPAWCCSLSVPLQMNAGSGSEAGR